MAVFAATPAFADNHFLGYTGSKNVVGQMVSMEGTPRTYVPTSKQVYGNSDIVYLASRVKEEYRGFFIFIVKDSGIQF